MAVFERIFCFIASTFFAFVFISSMDELGKAIGFEQMRDLGVAIVFGALYMRLAVMDAEKKDKEEEKDGAD